MKQLKLTEEDMHNLYDMMYMAEEGEGFLEDLGLNKMFEWYTDFFFRVEEIVCPDLNRDDMQHNYMLKPSKMKFKKIKGGTKVVHGVEIKKFSKKRKGTKK